MLISLMLMPLSRYWGIKSNVPSQSLTELFTPFYRVNLARDRNTGGTGLGLAIAKQAIIAHQGNIFAKNNETKGLSVTIQLPL